MTEILFEFIFVVSTASTVIPLTFFLWRRNYQPGYFKTISTLLGISIFLNLLIRFWKIEALPSSVIANAYTIIEFALLTIFYRKILFSKKAKLFSYTISIIFCLSLLGVGITSGLVLPNNYLWAISSTLLATYSILYFYFIPHMIFERYLDQHLFGNIVLNASLSFYFFTSIILFLFMDFVFHNLSAEQARAFWSIHNIVNILKNLGIAFAFFLSGKRKAYISIAQLEKLKRG